METTLARDVLLLTRVDKPALLRRLFDLGCRYSGQVLSYTKMLGQLHDAGNTVTLARYAQLLAHAGLLVGLEKFSARAVRQRSSSPKWQVLNAALASALSGLSFTQARQDREFWRRLVESAVGAHLANAAATGDGELFYWREGDREVDFVLRAGNQVVAIEVKTSSSSSVPSGVGAFVKRLKPQRTLLVGPEGISLEDFLLTPVQHWLEEP